MWTWNNRLTRRILLSCESFAYWNFFKYINAFYLIQQIQNTVIRRAIVSAILADNE